MEETLLVGWCEVARTEGVVAMRGEVPGCVLIVGLRGGRFVATEICIV
jgi:hypothetical protein